MTVLDCAPFVLKGQGRILSGSFDRQISKLYECLYIAIALQYLALNGIIFCKAILLWQLLRLISRCSRFGSSFSAFDRFFKVNLLVGSSRRVHKFHCILGNHFDGKQVLTKPTGSQGWRSTIVYKFGWRCQPSSSCRSFNFFVFLWVLLKHRIHWWLSNKFNG